MSGLRIGVLGASRIAELAIICPAATLGHRIVAVAARDRGRAETFARSYGVERVVDTYADLVADPEVDVVYNPLANAFHAPWNLAAIQAGKAVLAEKPFARNATEAEVVREAAHTRGTVVMEGFHYLFHPIIKRMFGLLADGTLGTLQHVEVVMKMPEPKPDDARWKLQLAGGCVMDLGCYGLHVNRQLARFAGGDPTIVSARGTERSPGVDASFDIDLAFPTGASGCDHQLDDRRPLRDDAAPDRREGRSVRPRLPAPVRRRPHRDHDRRRHHGRAPRNPLHVHLPTAGLRRPRPARHCRSHSTSTTPSRTCNTSTPPTPRPACPHADRNPLNRGKQKLDCTYDEIDLEHLTKEMAGGDELEALSHELRGKGS